MCLLSPETFNISWQVVSFGRKKISFFPELKIFFCFYPFSLYLILFELLLEFERQLYEAIDKIGRINKIVVRIKWINTCKTFKTVPSTA